MSFYRSLVLVGLIFWIAETAYFGWNKTPQSPQEQIADYISIIMVFWGIVGDITRNVHIQKFNTTHNNINTKTVEIKNAKIERKKKA